MSKKALSYKVQVEKFLADTLTPVNVYLRLRQKYPEVLLLESTDYRGSENSLSFICFNPLVTFSVREGSAEVSFAGAPEKNILKPPGCEITEELASFISSLELDQKEEVPNGFFGYCTYDSVKYFEDINIAAVQDPARKIPDIRYSFYEFLIVFNHFKNEIHILHNKGGHTGTTQNLQDVKQFIFSSHFPSYGFEAVGTEQSNITDDEQIEIIASCKKHIARGDVFQIVPSRRFIQKFRGDDFNVYRTLRSINPSPYLFYFDYGDYRIFGSSPEAQIGIKNGTEASIFPIAGTLPRRADRSNDAELAEELLKDPKENAEHVMLVDLARNDLSKHCSNVTVDVYREVQFYSHVIHLVSKVSGKLLPGASPVNVLADTFPAGTLSGAPKYKAMELIDRYEKGNRGIYGGCVGFISSKGDIVHAIVIRSFLSKGGNLYYQAGGGVVFDSNPQSELAEVKNKLGALKQAIVEAARMFSMEKE